MNLEIGKARKNGKGEFHHLNGPAIICTNGTKQWCRNGKFHRLDGPAIIWTNGDRFWFWLGKTVTEESYIYL